MSITPIIQSQSEEYSPNLESTDSFISDLSEQKKLTIKKGKKRKNFNKLAGFWRLIIITSVVFCFGGLGFGLALRYGPSWQNNNSLTGYNSTKN